MRESDVVALESDNTEMADTKVIVKGEYQDKVSALNFRIDFFHKNIVASLDRVVTRTYVGKMSWSRCSKTTLSGTGARTREGATLFC